MSNPRRRDIITFLGGALVAWPITAHAQPLRRIGVLMAFEENDPRTTVWLSRFTKGLSELGWSEERNLKMDVRWAANNVDRMPMFAKELVGLKPDVILAFGTPVTAALQRETRTIPIVLQLSLIRLVRVSFRALPIRAVTSRVFTIQKHR